MSQSVRFPYVDLDPSRPGAGVLPYIPLTLINQNVTASVLGLLDTGATVNVLPYRVGIQLGLR